MSESLDFSSLIEPLKIKVNGDPYPMHPVARFSLADLGAYNRLTREYSELMTGGIGNRTPEELQAATNALRGWVELIVPTMPSDVHDILTDAQRIRIVQAFLATAGEQPPEPAPAPETQEQTPEAPEEREAKPRRRAATPG